MELKRVLTHVGARRLADMPLRWVVLLVAVSCSPLSSKVTKEAIPQLPFRTLVENMEAYQGRTVILGGYTMGVVAVKDETYITVVQAPLNALHEPRSRHLSEGTFVVWHKGPLGSEAYEEGRPITVAGVVEGPAPSKGFGGCPDPCLLLKSRELYIRPKELPDPQERWPSSSGRPDVWDSPYPSDWYR